MKTKAKRVGQTHPTTSERAVIAQHAASKIQPPSDMNKSSRREPNSEATAREQIVRESHAAGPPTNTKAKSLGRLKRTKSERAVTATHAAPKGQPTTDSTNSARPESNGEKAPYQPTAREQIVLDRHAARRDATPPGPQLKLRYDGQSPPILLDHPDPRTACSLLEEALGTADGYFADGLLDQLIAVSSPYGQLNERDLNFMLSVIKGIKPTDQLEAMLAFQIALVQWVFARSGRELAMTPKPWEQENESILREIHRAARTFMGQLEALKRYRSGGEQKVTVQQVFSVNEGGQAIGNVNQAPREGTPEHLAKLTPALADARQPAMEMVGTSEAAPVPLRRRQNNGGPSST